MVAEYNFFNTQYDIDTASIFNNYFLINNIVHLKSSGMTIFKRFLAIRCASLGALILLFSPTQALDETPHTASGKGNIADESSNVSLSILCLTNKTGREVGYGYRWGDADYRYTKLRSNSTEKHWWNIDEEASVPDFFIELDHSDRCSLMRYRLDSYFSSKSDCKNAKRYVFKLKRGPASGMVLDCSDLFVSR